MNFVREVLIPPSELWSELLIFVEPQSSEGTIFGPKILGIFGGDLLTASASISKFLRWWTVLFLVVDRRNLEVAS